MLIEFNKETNIKAVKGIIENQEKYLLAKHNIQETEAKGKWTFLGGWIEASDKSFEEALQRELKEELQLDLDIKQQIGIYGYKDRLYLVLAATPKSTPVICSKEILEINWFNYEQIIEMGQKNLLQTGFELLSLKQYHFSHLSLN